jgi:hypothetical protein
MTSKRAVIGAAAGLALAVTAGPAHAATAGHPKASARADTAADWTWHRDVTFPDGWAIGGWEELTLRPDGSYRFQGHVHDSGGVSYDFGTVYAIRQPDARVLTFATTGHVRGTCFWFSCDGSRDYDWDISGTRSEVADARQTGFSAQASANTTLDLGAIFAALEKALGTVTQTVAIVGPFL